MGYRSSAFDDRDKLFDAPDAARARAAKKDLDGLFASKAPAANPCLQGHAWIRDWDGKNKCARCKTPKPAA